MKKIQLPQKADKKALSEQITEILKDYKPRLSGSKTILITRKAALTVVRINKKNVKVSGDLNYKYSYISVWLLIGILLGLVGVFIILIILYIKYNKPRKKLSGEVFNLLSNSLVDN